MIYSVHFIDGERELDGFPWELGLDDAVKVAPQFLGNCGATRGFILDDQRREVWAHTVG